MLSAILSALDTQDIIDSNTSIQALLERLCERVETNPASFKLVLEATHQIFHAIKGKSFKQVSLELNVCARIAGLCAAQITSKDTYHALFEHAINIQDFYLKKDKNDRFLLEQYVATCDHYSEMPSVGASATAPEHLFDLLDASRTALKAIENTPQKMPSAEERNKVPLRLSDINTAPDSALKSASTTYTLYALRARYAHLEHASNKSAAFMALLNDMYDRVYELKREYPLNARTRYDLNDEIIQELQMALEIQAAYITYLKTQRNSEVSQKTLQKTAFLFRTMNNYYQRSNASSALKADFAETANFMQKQSNNVKGIAVCEHLERSLKTSGDEKARAKEKKAEHLEKKEEGLSQICATYQALIGNADVAYSVIDCFTVTPDTHQLLTNEFSRIQASFPALSFIDFFPNVYAYVNHFLVYLAPQAGDGQDYLYYADDNNPDPESYFPDEVMDLSQSGLIGHDNTQALQLLQALELYYTTKIACLDEEYFSPTKHRSEAFISRLRFACEARLAAYRYLLMPLSTNDPLQIKQDCENILNNQAVVLPLIHALAQQRLMPANAAIQAQNDAAHAQLLLDMGGSKSELPGKKLSKKARQRKNQRERAAKEKLKQAEEESKHLSELSFLESTQQVYDEIPLSAPGWHACKEAVLLLLTKKNQAGETEAERVEKYVKALLLIDDWIEGIEPQTEDTPLEEALLRDKGLYDGFLHKAIILKCQKNYDEAMRYLGKAWQHLAPEETHQRVRDYQIQKMMLEKGMIYSLRGDVNLATIAFIEAEQMADKNDTFCFYLLYQQLELSKEFSTFNARKEALAPYQKILARLLDKARPIFVDEYNQGFFYEFCDTIAPRLVQIGSTVLKQAKGAKALNQPFSALEQEGKHYINQCVEIYSLLLHRSKKHVPHRMAEFELNLVATYRVLRTLSPTFGRKYLTQAEKDNLAKARKSLDNANQLATLAQQTMLLDRIKVERALLKRDHTTAIREAVTERAIQLEPQQKLLEMRETVFAEYMNRPVPIIGDMESQQAAMLKAIQSHTSFEEVANIFRVLAFWGRSPMATQGKVQFQDKMEMVGLKELAEIGLHLGALTMFCQGELTRTKASGRVTNALMQQYTAEIHYLANMMRMMYAQKSANEMGLPSTPHSLFLDFSMQTTKVKQLESIIVKETGRDVEPTLPDCLTANSAHIHLNMSDTELKGFEAMASMPEAFKAALHRIQLKQFWIALHDLLACTKDETLDLTPGQKSVIYFLMGQIMHWTLEQLSFDLFAKMSTAEEKNYFGLVFDHLKVQCDAAFKNAKCPGSLFSEDRVTEICKTVGALQLPNAALAIDDGLALTNSM